MKSLNLADIEWNLKWNNRIPLKYTGTSHSMYISKDQKAGSMYQQITIIKKHHKCWPKAKEKCNVSVKSGPWNSN